MAQNKKRLDLILFELKYFDSKSSAAANIIAQNVKINGQLITKAGTLYDENFFNNPEKPVDIEINSIPFVSRGGLKLQGAIEKFGIDFLYYICYNIWVDLKMYSLFAEGYKNLLLLEGKNFLQYK